MQHNNHQEPLCAESRASRNLRRTELTWNSDTIELPYELRATLRLGKLGMLPADALSRQSAKGITHLTSHTKSDSGSHPAMHVRLHARCFRCCIKHSEV